MCRRAHSWAIENSDEISITQKGIDVPKMRTRVIGSMPYVTALSAGNVSGYILF